jgi:predicted AlkP superfamily pyrophosphatase or phosphodiesterase
MHSVLIAVFDGLQPAQVTPELTPTLFALAAQGVIFASHHSVFPTVTRANAASMVTGRSPGGHGLAANTLVVRDFDPHQAIPALEPQLAQVARKTGKVLIAPTLADILAQHGKAYVAVGVGTSGNAYIHNPRAELSGGATIHPDFTLPYSLNEEIIARFGPWPPETPPNTPRMAHAVRIMTEYILPERKPLVSLSWSSEPDKSQHDAGVGSEMSNAAIKDADRRLGRLMGWLEETGRARETDILVVSDHGYSTITEVIKVERLLRKAGFPPGGAAGGVTVASNGGSVLFYIHKRDKGAAERLVAWLMEQPWCGAITASATVAGIPGTLPAALVGDEGPRAPEITMSFRWNSQPNNAGYCGYTYSTGGASGLGQHGSMSQHELRNILFAWGPSFKQGVTVDNPSGNIDLAPTILRTLGISTEACMDGRVLEEALAGGPEAREVEWSIELHNAERKVGGKVYRQQITVSRVGNTTYVNEGNSTLGRR